ncbi:phosphatidylethanolamine-binding protein homolog F40A3.3-like [Planococcus citri]|uniref:phosphatidylethanolamine-binding protein homolog F40A3.3-like n=1 Tax=Planococcus citri TaxID=170843 RepID=UPI0031F9D4BC
MFFIILYYGVFVSFVSSKIQYTYDAPNFIDNNTEIIDVEIASESYKEAQVDSKPGPWQKFIEHKIVPMIVPVPPTKSCEVIYGKNVKAEFGNIIAYADLQKEPNIQFEADKDKFYCIYMSGVRFFPDYHLKIKNLKTTYRKPLKYEWHQWIVGNIPGNKTRAGDVLWPYGEVIVPIPIYTQEYNILIYEQKRRMKFSKKGRRVEFVKEYLPVHRFAKHHYLGDPIFGNYFLQGA